MATFTSKATGAWEAEGATTWNEAGHPVAGDAVTIQNTHNVTATAAAATTVTVASGGTLSIASGTTTISGTLTVTGALLWTSSTGILDVDTLVVSAATGSLTSNNSVVVTCTVRTAFTNNRNTAYVVVLGGHLGGGTWTFGTASQSATITNNGIVGHNDTSSAVTVTVTLQAASSAFPWTWSGTAPNTDDNGGANKNWIFQDGIMTPAITTGAAQNDTFTAYSCRFLGAITVSAGDAWKSVSSVYNGAITATGTFWSANHQRLGRYAYGPSVAFSTINDNQYLPKVLDSIQVISGTLTVDRGHFNEATPPTASAAFLELVLSDLIVPTGTTCTFDDKVRVRLPKGYTKRSQAGTINFGALGAFADIYANGPVNPVGNPPENKRIVI